MTLRAKILCSVFQFSDNTQTVVNFRPIVKFSPLETKHGYPGKSLEFSRRIPMGNLEECSPGLRLYV